MIIFIFIMQLLQIPKYVVCVKKLPGWYQLSPILSQETPLSSALFYFQTFC